MESFWWKLLSRVAPQVVKMTTFSAANSEKFYLNDDISFLWGNTFHGESMRNISPSGLQMSCNDILWYSFIASHCGLKHVLQCIIHDDVIKCDVIDSRVTCPLWGESTGHRWISLTKVDDASFGVFFDLRLNKCAHYDVIVIIYPNTHKWCQCTHYDELV